MSIWPQERWDSTEQYLLYLRHLAAYVLFAQKFTSGKRVLEVGCGKGYGAREMAKSASHITALDLSYENVSGCRIKYPEETIAFVAGNWLALPFKDNSFDVVVSFQVIDHLPVKLVPAYLSEIKRVLALGGHFLLSTPNPRLRLLPFQHPWNEEHYKEYRPNELKAVLGRVFEKVSVYGLCAGEEALAIEKNRVKQEPFKAYIVFPAYRLLGRFLPPALINQARKVFRTSLRRDTDSGISIERFSLDDFRVDPACPEDCLDLYSVCQNIKCIYENDDNKGEI